MSQSDLTPGESAVLLLDEAENLIWALLDDQLGDADTARLSELLQNHEEVRRRYVDCVQLHVDLQGHFAGAPGGHAPQTSPNVPSAVLTGLMPGNLTGGESPVGK